MRPYLCYIHIIRNIQTNGSVFYYKMNFIIEKYNIINENRLNNSIKHSNAPPPSPLPRKIYGSLSDYECENKSMTIKNMAC